MHWKYINSLKLVLISIMPIHSMLFNTPKLMYCIGHTSNAGLQHVNIFKHYGTFSFPSDARHASLKRYCSLIVRTW